ncbi:hypothetical protein [Bacillus multifaciens]|uniref:hypothetical protein n=1 Tax=Bacillus multifaciens TaxID=3068506 RepID=UPI0027423C9F|nr:hypothetical protein [Bacillus sp. WLY-B-L8]MDP7977662.1 hypothetical protein [Bacillus sp. WLY-B-L8]
MLQERINELESGILTIDRDKVYVMGFNNEKMLMSFFNNNKKNWSFIGLYDSHKLDFNNIKNNALIIVMKDGKEIGKYQYIPVYKGTIKYDNKDGKSTSVTFTIRKSIYSKHYHFLSEKMPQVFESKEFVTTYLREEFGASIDF